ncbi:mannose-1-phosphate guanylyltransferase/mannose-6-phosphate isomerase [Microvirga terrae]|uniref:mannose-1-phosphate guanylyltransferase n=1 Tax=Microvirga terrae TaxID=2740529 RepID=A0ABY5RXP2_9HYPH|nr:MULTISPECIES: mannose-1-phosphate guanylyltransferase/mannose-6-phosphate isomerase [Microvirga]MBQ0822442.1 mannose-1-phosphate guanylyltransferase/mannose-6-phosphate isomerase [Microvirga sp. HBU67558]UVF20709.1 mannose-1-phosphate guanylyltransferase/mannose-6-phosphate isomerase [Microvirga terrae]
MNSIIPVLMCGGSGTRLWPVSRSSEPKQFHALAGQSSLFQQTVRRFRTEQYAEPVIVVNTNHRDLALREIGQLHAGAARLLVEPCVRSTGPAIAAAASLIAEEDPDRLMLVAPSDHVMEQAEIFSEAVAQAAKAAQQGQIVLFGIRPTQPETGFGYIEIGEAFDDASFKVRGFVEKPARAVAETLVAGERHLWNSGIFMFTARTILDELERHAPDVLACARHALALAQRGNDTIRLAAEFDTAPVISIDYAVMERSDRLVCIPVSPEWRDLGSWSALWDIGSKDGNGNVSRGDTLLQDVRDSYVHGNSRLVAVMGVENVVVIDTADAVLVSSLDQAQNVGRLAAELAASKRSEAALHRKVRRPWGSYESLRVGETFQVKHIVVDVAGRLSLQYHHHRSEHWTVVSGTARVTVGEKVFVMTANESVYIPKGDVHRLENIGDEELHLIEVQCGTYLGEDDIVRLEDQYDRIVTI